MFEIKIIKDKINKDELAKIANEGFGEIIKIVVDIENKILAVGGEMHSDEAEALFDAGSKSENLWGINIFPNKPRENWIEFNSLINIKPTINQSMDIENQEIKEKIVKIINDIIV